MPENAFCKSSDTPGEEQDWMVLKKKLDGRLTELTAE
jgi:hypothetical protein